MAVIYGTDGNDILNDTTGDDTVYGYAGDDYILGRPGNDLIIMGDGDDQIITGVWGSTGNDTIDAGAGNDSIGIWSMGDGLSLVTGGAGADQFTIAVGVDYGVPGMVTRITDFTPGEDSFRFAGTERPTAVDGPDGVVMTMPSGAQVIFEGVTLYELVSSNFQVFANTVSHFDHPERLFGAEGQEILWGGLYSELLVGGGGNDIVLGGGGNDTLGGNHGNDTLDGGAGNDVIYGHKGNNLLLGGDGNDFISSGDQSSTLEGGAGDDVLQLRMKAGGDHVATGGAGADIFEFVYFDARKQADVVITDFELGIDSLTIGGQDAAAYFSSHAGASLTDVAGGALLMLEEGDTIELAGLSVAEINDWYLGGAVIG